ncbi:hypothetical protein ACWGOQ_0015760 [Aquimarina sp. M1]
MKRILILLLTGITVFSCSNDDDNNVNPSNCDLTTLISASEYTNAPSDQVTINSVTIADTCLAINLSAGGCDGNT